MSGGRRWATLLQQRSRQKARAARLAPSMPLPRKTAAAREEARHAQASLETMAARAGWHRARVTEDGCIVDFSAETARRLRRFFGDPLRARTEAPAILQEWLRRRSRHWGLEYWRRESSGPLIVRRDGTRLTIHFIADPVRPERGELLMPEEIDAGTRHLACSRTGCPRGRW